MGHGLGRQLVRGSGTGVGQGWGRRARRQGRGFIEVVCLFADGRLICGLQQAFSDGMVLPRPQVGRSRRADRRLTGSLRQIWSAVARGQTRRL